MSKQWLLELEEKRFAKNEATLTETIQDYANISPDEKKKVGAAIVSYDSTVIALGVNRLMEGYPNANLDWHDKSWKTFAIIHAEHDALLDLQTHTRHVIRPAYAMIVTHTPCEQCSKLLAMSEIRHIHIMAHQEKRQNSVDFLNLMGFDVSIANAAEK